MLVIYAFLLLGMLEYLGKSIDKTILMQSCMYACRTGLVAVSDVDMRGLVGAESSPPKYQIPGLGPRFSTYIVWCSYMCNKNVNKNRFIIIRCFFSSSKCTKTHFRPGFRSGLRWRSLRHSLRPHTRLEKGTPPSHSPPAWRLRRLDLGACGASFVSPMEINPFLRHWSQFIQHTCRSNNNWHFLADRTAVGMIEFCRVSVCLSVTKCRSWSV